MVLMSKCEDQEWHVEAPDARSYVGASLGRQHTRHVSEQFLSRQRFLEI